MSDDAAFQVKKPRGTVEFDGHSWTIRPRTRGSIKASTMMLDLPNPIVEPDDAERAAAAYAAYIDSRLVAANGDPPAGELLLEHWRSDEVGLDELVRLVNHLLGALEESDPPPTPTSGSTTSSADTSE